MVINNQIKNFDYESPNLNALSKDKVLRTAWAKVPQKLNDHDRDNYKKHIKELLKQHNATLIAHYYVDADIQDLALETGGCVGDSLEMARFGVTHPAQTLLVAGVKFMGETAKILSPEKRVFIADLDANCSLDLGCTAEQFKAFCDQHPDRTVVVYANTSAEVKALSDWVVTSSIGIEIIEYLHQRGEKIIWAPDRHLGQYIQEQTGADMLLWQGSCMVHNEFKAKELAALKQQHPTSKILAHPESPAAVVALADIVGSTKKLLQATIEDKTQHFIVATDTGILHEMRKRSPEKQFTVAPTAGHGATCQSCASCPWMAMSGLKNIAEALENGSGEISLDPQLMARAKKPIQRMLDFFNQR